MLYPGIAEKVNRLTEKFHEKADDLVVSRSALTLPKRFPPTRYLPVTENKSYAFFGKTTLQRSWCIQYILAESFDTIMIMFMLYYP
jgi:hypothetical protein